MANIIVTLEGIGPPGPAGPQGPQGLQGPQGPQGITGATGHGIATGGTTGQVLAKISDADYDSGWETLAGSGDMTAAVYDPQNIHADAFDVDHHTNGTVNKVYSAADKTRLANTSGTNTGDQTLAGLGGVPATRQVNGHALSGDVTVTASDVGLGNCNNTSDANKPISSATQTALNAKADLVTGKVPMSQLASGTPDGTKYVRDDGTLATPAGGGGGGGTWGSITGTLSSQTDLQTALNAKAPLASPTFTGTVGGVTAAMVGAPSGSGTSTGTNTGDQDLSSLVTGPASATDSHVVIFNGTTGKLIKDSGLTLSGSNTGDQTLPTDATITTTDVTTNNASTTKHGWLLKAVAPAANQLNVVGIANGETVYANKTLLDATTPSTQAFGDSAAAGTSLAAAHADHKHAMMAAPTSVTGNAGTVTNATLTTALTIDTGTVTIHGNSANTSVLTLGAGASSVSGANTGDQTIPTGGTPALTLGTANSAGSSANFLRRDDTILAFDATAPSTQAFGDSAAVGIATVAARRDHKHAMPAAPTASSVGLGNVTNDAQVKKAASSTSGAIPTWSGTTGDTLNTGGLAAPSGTIVGTTDTQTLTNKRVSPRVLSASSYTTDTGTSLNCDTMDMFIVTAQAGALKFNNPGGTPVDGQKLWLAVTGTAAQALTYDTAFESSTVTLPTTTVTTNRIDIGLVFRADTSKWRCVAVA